MSIYGKPCSKILRPAVLMTSVLIMAAKCSDVDVTDPKIAAAITEINASLQPRYQDMLNDVGTRHFDIDRTLAADAMRRTLEALGFTVVNAEGNYYISVTMPAPGPIDAQEWQQVKRLDEPMYRRIAAKHLGFKGNFFQLEPEGLMVDGIVTLVESGEGIDISITLRLREIKPQPPESILPRRDYAPPTAVKIGYEKIWELFEEQALPLADMAASG